MVPRTVQAQKQISTLIGAAQEVLGNVIGPQGFGWSNLTNQWFLGGPETLGNPAMFSFYVHHYNSDGEPFYAQPQHRKQVNTGSFLYPVGDKSEAPPLTTVETSLF